MSVLWIGHFDGITGTGEIPDSKHMARCLGETGMKVDTVDQAEIKANFDQKKENNIPEGEYDIILLCKWHHHSEDLIKWVKDKYKGKLVYILWDFMGKPEGWHKMILENCDLYLSGEVGMLPYFKEMGLNYQYFNFDTSDGQYDQLPRDEKYDVVFTGSYIEKSYRTDILRKVKDNFNLTVFSHDHERWKENGFSAEPGKYDANFNQISAQSKVMLVMNWPEPSAETTGYQSNRIGKILTTGGMPLVHYFPMADRLLGDNVMFFYDEEDLMDKIKWLLDNPPQRETARTKAYDFGRREYTTQVRMRQLKIILESL